MQKYAKYWVPVASKQAGLDDSAMRQEENILAAETLQAGIDILFSLEALKSSQDSFCGSHDGPLFYFSGQSAMSRVVITALLKAYVQEIRKYRTAIFGSSSKSNQEQTTESKAREAGFGAFNAAYQVFRSQETSAELSESLVALLAVVEEADLVQHGSEKERAVLLEISNFAVSRIVAKEGEFGL